MFMVMGLGILVEQWWNGDKNGGPVQRVVVWTIATVSAGWAYRTLERHAKNELFRSDRYRMEFG